MSETQLTTNKAHPIVRIGNIVHRPTNWWTPAVHELLNYLEKVGFKYSPRVLGFDKEGREMLSFIEGESGKEDWKKIITDEGLRKYAKFLRKYHDVVADFHPSEKSEWAYAKGGVKQDEIICHGDFGVWNIVWQGQEPVGIIDWDFVLPAKPKYDVLYALEYSAPFRDDETALKFHHFPKIPDRKHRIKIFLEAYGAIDIENIVDEIAELQRTVGRHEAYLASKGLQPQAEWVANGDLEVVENHAKWTEQNRDLFE